jgi:HEAT repeat protein
MKRLGLLLLTAAFLVGGGLWVWQGSERDLVLDLASRDPDVVMAASRRLWEDSREGIDIGPTLLRGMQHPSPRVRSRAVLTLARLQVTSYADEAVALLADPDQGVRIQAARALRTLQGWSTPVPLLRSLEDRAEALQVRMEVASALEKRKEPAAEVALARIATDPSEPLELRQEALEALGGLGAETKAQPMVQILLDPKQPIRLRQAAIAGLARLSGPDARSALILIARSPEQAVSVRAHAAASLGCQGQADEQALLRDLVASPAPPCRSVWLRPNP